MSRIGKLPIEIPSGVTITVDPDMITVSGPKGSLKQATFPGITVTVEGNTCTVTRKNDDPEYRSKHGLMRTLVSNMVIGLTEGFEKKLELSGVGFRVSQAGSELKFSLGYSHEITYTLPDGVTASVEKNVITVNGYDKQQVGQAAAEIRALRKPEPYKGKGIAYVGERIIRKSGKSGTGKE